MEKSTNVEFREVKFLAPVPLINWLNEQADSQGIDGDQFLNALLYAVWGNYLQNNKNLQNAEKELQTPS